MEGGASVAVRKLTQNQSKNAINWRRQAQRRETITATAAAGDADNAVLCRA